MRKPDETKIRQGLEEMEKDWKCEKDLRRTGYTPAQAREISRRYDEPQMEILSLGIFDTGLSSDEGKAIYEDADGEYFVFTEGERDYQEDLV